MSARRVTVVATDSANLASVAAALERVGAQVTIASEASALRDAGRLVLPGVGAFGAVMHALQRGDLASSLRTWISSGRPLLAICLGLQILAAESEESPGVPGLGLVPGRAERFPAGVRTPQLGWNRVVTERPEMLVEDGHAYYANSYALSVAPPGWTPSWSEHGRRFLAAIQRGPQLACQFHPELSGAWGARLIARWFTTC